MSGDRRRQARGARRMAMLLDAAAEVFGRVGYEAATTNAIAARAGVSPGTLYQFYSNKEAMARALADRFVEQLQAVNEVAFSDDAARLPLDRMIDRMVDPLVAFNVANPAFAVLLGGAGTPSAVAGTARHLHEEGLARIDALLAALAPDLPPEERRRRAFVSKQLTKALLPAILAADNREREQLVTELKRVLSGYLRPLAIGRPGSPAPETGVELPGRKGPGEPYSEPGG